MLQSVLSLLFNSPNQKIMEKSRRKFIRNMAGIGTGLAASSVFPGVLSSCNSPEPLFFSISLAQWSLNNTLKRWTSDGYTDGKDPLDFPVMARNQFGIDAVEYVNTFYYEKAEDKSYLSELKNRCEGEGVKSLLIMVDSEGNLGDPDEEMRNQAVANHYKWIEAAKFLGCHSIRVNARSEGSWEEQMKLASEGLHSLCEFADGHGINVIVENHGGLSSNGKWLSGVMEMVDHPLCGTLPDFGNFRISDDEEYDRYLGMEELMPWAKGVSAKSHEFDDEGNEVRTDYYKMLRIVKDSGYRGYIDIEYEGSELSEPDGILATKALLEKAGAAVMAG
jgi:L-ribulose-5-phosphate 3-epimerase